MGWLRKRSRSKGDRTRGGSASAALIAGGETVLSLFGLLKEGSGFVLLESGGVLLMEAAA